MKQGEVDNGHLPRDLRVSSSEELRPQTLEALQRAIKGKGGLSSGTAVMADLFAAASGSKDLGLLRKLTRGTAQVLLDRVAARAAKVPRRRSERICAPATPLPPDVLRFHPAGSRTKGSLRPPAERKQPAAIATEPSTSVRRARMWSGVVRSMYLAVLGLLLAVCGTALLLLPSAWHLAPDVFWIVATMALGSVVLFRQHPGPAMLFALIGASFGESIFRVANLPAPALHLGTVAPVGMWALLLLPAARLSRTGIFLVRCAIATNLIVFGAAFFGYDTTPFWTASFAIATFSLTQRSFSIGAFSNPQIALSAAALIPLATDLLIAQLGIPLYYGSLYITAENIWLSVAPLGCVVFYAVRIRKKEATYET